MQGTYHAKAAEHFISLQYTYQPAFCILDYSSVAQTTPDFEQELIPALVFLLWHWLTLGK